MFAWPKLVAANKIKQEIAGIEDVVNAVCFSYAHIVFPLVKTS